MCFSATASIGAGIVLTGLGAASVRSVTEKRQKLFAAIPLGFGIQQFAEGMLWISLGDSAWQQVQPLFMYSFLFFALLVWPVVMPLAFIQMEDNQIRKRWMKVTGSAGIIVAAYFLYCLITRQTHAVIESHHIQYQIDFPKALIPFAAFLYILSTGITPLLSSHSRIRIIGMIIISFYILARLVFQPSLISVWCFFSAVICILIYLVLREKGKSNVNQLREKTV